MTVKPAIFKILILAILISVLVPFIGSHKTNSEAFAQWLEYYPNYPNRLRYIVSELNQTTQDLEYFNRELNNQLSQCSCANAVSQCAKGGNLGVFGDPCNNREEIKKTKAKIKDKIEQVSFIEELLRLEMETGLAEELKRIDEDEAIILEEGLNNILASTNGITSSALKNIEIVDNENYSSGNQCQAQCNQKAIPSINACVFSSGGGQKPISMGFEVGIGLEDLELGGVRIDEIELNLPERIQMSNASKMDDFTIGLENISIVFPQIPTTRTADLSLDPIVFHPPSPDVPVIPPAGFSCNQLNVSTFSCAEESAQNTYRYTNLEWFLQTFSWLSNKCQSLPGLNDENGTPVQEKYEKCFSEEEVHITVVNQCNSLWASYNTCISGRLTNNCNEPPEICKNINNPSQAIARECQSLFQTEGEPAPANCNLSALENKCEQLKEANRENIPDQCKFLPLFNGSFENPGTQTYQTPPSTCTSQTISNNSQSALRLDCPPVPSFGDTLIPKIKLPDIIIPDIQLPSFEFMPFVRVHMPNLIFEDLILDDLEFCNLDDCKRAISSMKVDFNYPFLRIPDIKIPPLYANMPKIPNGPQIEPLPIEIGDIKFPPIPIPMPEIDLANLISLNMDLSNISLPTPEVILNFEGVEIDMGNMLLGLISGMIPNLPSGCVSAGISGLPLGIDLPDYYFSWPKFPQIPDLCNNKYISINNFCSSVNNSLKRDVASRIKQIENVLNTTIQSQIQNKLDNAAALLEELIIESVHEQLAEIRRKVENAVADSVSQTKENNGMFEIPEAYAALDNINVAMDKINTELAKIANNITIPWPDSLKRIPLTNPINYKLPSIPLSNLSYVKHKKFNLPGFQTPSFDFSVEVSSPFTGYEGTNPSGGNPYPINEINVNINELINTKQSIKESSNKIYDVLY